MRRKIAIVVAFAIAIILIVVIVVVGDHGTKKKTTSTTTAISFTDSKQSPTNSQSSQSPKIDTSNDALASIIANDDNPDGVQYKATSSAQPTPGWFVVHVIATNSAGSFNQIVVLHQDSASVAPDVDAGPDTSFPISYLNSIGVPQAVIDVLPTYDDSQ